ncbi:hypothetical protein [Xylanivirga thermophila]|jgi:hypothetical protein|uniref:hypothetical protein n=1 Tax=Xylanivirga thermophila TaxID=2496273 RepID=UPI00101D9611|nr:hypothetical protein [Xylanivirga thermophila]
MINRKNYIVFIILSISIALPLCSCTSQQGNNAEYEAMLASMDKDIDNLEKWIDNAKTSPYKDANSFNVEASEHIDIEGIREEMDNRHAQLSDDGDNGWASVIKEDSNKVLPKKGRDDDKKSNTFPNNNYPGKIQKPQSPSKAPWLDNTNNDQKNDPPKDDKNKLDDNKDKNKGEDEPKKQYIKSINIEYSDLATDISVQVTPAVYSVKANNTDMQYNGRNRYNLSIAGLKKGSTIDLSMYDMEGRVISTQKCIIQ